MPETYKPVLFRTATAQSLLFQFGPVTTNYANAPEKAASVQFSEIPRGVGTPQQVAAAGRSERVADLLRELEDDVRMSRPFAKGHLIEITTETPPPMEPQNSAPPDATSGYEPAPTEPGKTGVEGFGDPAHPVAAPGGGVHPDSTPAGPSAGNPPGIVTISPASNTAPEGETPAVPEDEDGSGERVIDVVSKAEAAQLLINEHGATEADLQNDNGNVVWEKIDAYAKIKGIRFAR